MTIDEPRQSDGRDFKAYGWLIIIGSIAAVAGMAMHPSGGGKIMETVRELVVNGGFNALLHGFLVAVYLALVLGFWGFGDWLGRDHLAIRGGLVAYAAAALAATAAAMSAGFVNRTLAFNYANAKPDEINAVVSAFRVSGAFNYAWGRMWMIALSAAFLLWSLELIRRNGLARMLGYLGLALGVAGIIGIPSGLIPLSVGALLAVIVGQTLWSIGAGVLMIRKPT